MQNAHTRKTAFTFFLYFTTDLQRKQLTVFKTGTEPAVIIKTEPNLKNPMHTFLAVILLLVNNWLNMLVLHM